MAHFGFSGEVEQLLVDLLACQRRNRERRHKMTARLGEDRTNLSAAVTQTADQLKALVSRDPATDDEKYTLADEVQTQLLIKSEQPMDYLSNYDMKV